MDFHGRRGAALVIGATGGVGSAVARMLAARGCALAATYRGNLRAANTLVAEIPGTRAWRLDLTDAAACAVVVAEAAEAFGGLHTLVYAAGPPVRQAHLSTVTPAQFQVHLEQEAVGFFNVLAPALRSLREARGSLVAVTTAATSRFAVRDGLSAAPKGAVEAVVRGIAAEEGRYGVRANCVAPGFLTDGMATRLIASGDLDARALAAAKANTPLGFFGSPEDVAEAVCFLASDRARFITGQRLAVDGGYTV